MQKMHGVDRGKSRSAKQQKQQQKQQQQQLSSASLSVAVEETAVVSSSSDQPKQQQKRTGLAINEEQQRRIAARAARAMENQIRRRRKHWSSLVWGDRGKKAVIKRYPNGREEILVPQTLTPDEEHYEFPPRSRLLKKLASSNAERRRLQPSTNTPLATPYIATASSTTAILPVINNQQQHLLPPTIQPSLSPPKPDPLAMNEWFSSRKRDQKDQDVIEWIDNVEKSKHLLSPSMGHTPGTSESGDKPPLMVQFPDEADKQQKIRSSPSYAQTQQQQQQQQQQRRRQRQRQATSSASLLAPPLESAAKHYVPRRLLRPRDDETSAMRAQEFWRGYREHKKPVGGMVRLVGMFHLALEQHQRAAQERLSHLEVRVTDERRQREQHQTKHLYSQKRLDELVRGNQQQQEQQQQRVILEDQRLASLEQTVQAESVAREHLEHTVSSALQQMSLLEKSIQEQAEQSRITRKNLQKQLDTVISEIRTIRSARR